MHVTTYVPSYIFRGDRMDLAGVLLRRPSPAYGLLAYKSEFREFDASIWYVPLRADPGRSGDDNNPEA